MPERLKGVIWYEIGTVIGLVLGLGIRAIRDDVKAWRAARAEA